MEISLKLIIYMIFYVIIIFSRNFVTPSTNISLFNDIMNEIINDCYKNLENIFIFEHLDTQMKPSGPIMEMESVKYIRNKLTKKAHSIPTTKIDAYFILTNTSSIFNQTFNMLGKMKIWKNNRPIFIFAIYDDNNHTSLFNHFWNDWSILIFYYIYVDSEGQVSVLTSNPYKPYAPEYWRHINTSTEISVFHRKYFKGEICQGFVFDRTHNLTNVTLLFVSVTTSKADFYFPLWNLFCDGHWPETLSIFETAFNTQTRLYCVSTSARYLEQALEVRKYKPDLFFFTTSHESFELSYPPIFIANIIVSHNQGYQTLFEQMYNLFGKWIVLYTCCLLTITFIVCFYFAKTDRTAFAIFEVIRLLISSSIRTNMNTLTLKIFFLMILFYIVIIQSLFQGKLAGFLTNPSTKKNADTLDDLESPLYGTILYATNKKALMANEKVSNKSYKVLTLNTALRIFKNDKSTALVDIAFNVGAFLIRCLDEDVYVSKEPFAVRPFSYMLRKENPLNERINKLLILHHELGFTDQREKFVTKNLRKGIDRLESMSLIKGVNRPINIKSMMPLMIFLISGWITAIICFIEEFPR
ncbi:uncharacterized protein [Chelonus insularis]|uniref:uncharacterized protein n=1 Tax=Chelonus insularis TaxID=460826 RepID=UPI00158ECB33|nr:uncharacterized protein LOC118072225 [Chelonus insularis]